MRKHLLELLACLFLSGGITWAATVYVDDDTCPSPGSGTQSDPYCDIQMAIDSAQPGDVVQVAEGIYTA